MFEARNDINNISVGKVRVYLGCGLGIEQHSVGYLLLKSPLRP